MPQLTLHRRALILDPDREWYEPYWVPESALIEAMATGDASSGVWRGFLWIRRPAAQTPP